MSLFEDLFENQQRPRHISQQKHAFGRQNNHHDNDRNLYREHDSHYFHRRDRDDFSHIGSFARKLVNNKTLLVLVGVVLVVALGLLIAALVFLLPLVPKLLGYLDSIGVKDLLEQGMAILAKVLAVGGK
jgi:hypothetical protein